ncbi:MAG: 8-amino-7-oxononanoate synthase [Caulobacteraceae bacterium]|nr:8-amino-7-oxononanoate synthase [Caulobacteraceae bacterium]
MSGAWRALEAALAGALAEAEGKGRRRRLRPMTRIAGGRVMLADGRTLIDFSSNDYLGLSLHPQVAARAADYAQRLGAGSAGSRLVTGTLIEHLQVEARLAAFKRAEAALLFASGYQANASILPALIGLLPAPVKVFADRLNHASLHAGLAQADLRQIRFRHNDLDHLERQLQALPNQGASRLIVTETVFSMDGDRADLAGLADLADRYDAILYLDEAHATGVFGPHGAGLAAELPACPAGGRAPAIVMGTLGKALGGFGAYVAGPQLLIDALVQACGGFIYSTAPPPAVLGALDAALDLVPGMGAERAALQAAAGRVRRAAAARGFDTLGSSTQIVPLQLGAESWAMKAMADLEAAGLLGVAIRPPTVPEGSSRLRLSLSTVHSDADIDRLVEAIGALA